jgi:hypothetical protein
MTGAPTTLPWRMTGTPCNKKRVCLAPLSGAG